MAKFTQQQINAAKNLPESMRAQIQQQYGLVRVPSAADVQEFMRTGSFAKPLYGNQLNTSQKAQLIQAGVDPQTVNNYRPPSQTSTPTTNTQTSPTNQNTITRGAATEVQAPTVLRDAYIQNVLKAQYGIFDRNTELGLERFSQSREDMDINMQFYRQDFERMTNRKTQDYYYGISLRNKEFSKSLDYISQVASRSIGALAGVGKSRITESTSDKMEQDTRIQLNFNRALEDSNIAMERQEGRYKLGTTRLTTAQSQYEDARQRERGVLGIQTAAGITQQRDTLLADTFLQEDYAAANRRDIIGGGTGIQNIY